MTIGILFSLVVMTGLWSYVFWMNIFNDPSDDARGPKSFISGFVVAWMAVAPILVGWVVLLWFIFWMAVYVISQKLFYYFLPEDTSDERGCVSKLVASKCWGVIVVVVLALGVSGVEEDVVEVQEQPVLRVDVEYCGDDVMSTYRDEVIGALVGSCVNDGNMGACVRVLELTGGNG